MLVVAFLLVIDFIVYPFLRNKRPISNLIQHGAPFRCRTAAASLTSFSRRMLFKLVDWFLLIGNWAFPYSLAIALA
jgi:hypothetical protein